MKILSVYLTAIATLCYSAVVIAQTPVELYHDLQEKKEAGLMKEIAPGIRLGGLFEIESIYSTNGGDAWSLDLATAEVNVDAIVSENITAGIVLLFEEGDDFFAVDEATVALNELLASDLYIVGGLMTLPFGTYATHFIDDTLGQVLGETSEVAVQLLYLKDMFSLSGTVFNSDVDKAGEDDVIEDFIVTGSITPVENLTLTASYISNILNSDELSDMLEADTVTDIATGIAAAVAYVNGCIQIDAEYLFVVDEIKMADLDLDDDGDADDSPWALNLEVAYCVPKWELALKYETADEFEVKSRYGIAASKFIAENTLITVQFLHSELDAGGDEDSAGALLAVEF